MKKLKSINKKVVIPTIVAATLLLSIIYGSRQVLADDTFPYPPIVKKIADTFGLDESDVEEVFNQERADEWEKRKQTIDGRLTQAVNDKVITEEQKQAILDKRDELQAERYAERQGQLDEMKAWFNEQGINQEGLTPYLGLGRRQFNHEQIVQ